MGRLEGKRALITGAGSGMGEASALRFAAEGARVAVVDLDLAAAERTVAAIAAEGGDAVAVAADVSRDADAAGMIETAIAAFGGLDILFNNAGTCPFGMVHEISDDEWRKVIAVNLTGVFLGTRHALPHLAVGGRGAVVNTASSAGIGGVSRMAHYCAAKTAVVSLTRSVAMDYASAGIRANAICPGSIDTPMLRGAYEAHVPDAGTRAAVLADHCSRIPAGKLGRPEDMAALALFLASDEAAFVTGQAIATCGGQTIGHMRPSFKTAMAHPTTTGGRE